MFLISAGVLVGAPSFMLKGPNSDVVLIGPAKRHGRRHHREASESAG